MPTDKKRVTVGIPSYNEEINISNLLRSIIDVDKIEKQSSVTNQFGSVNETNGLSPAEGFAISEIIVSDDSSDSTCRIVEGIAAEYKSLSIRLLHHESRRGVSAAWNEIFEKATGDIIILYDADIIINKNTTANLVQSISDGIGLCASNSMPLVLKKSTISRASAFIAGWLRWVRKSRLSEYTAMGRGLSVPSLVAKRITIPENVIALDLYLQCKVLELGFKVVYNDHALVYFAPPDNMADFASQIIRAAHGHKQIHHLCEGICNPLPFWTGLLSAYKSILKDPKGAVCLMGCYSLLPYYRTKLEDAKSSKWYVAKSTKGLNYHG